MKNKFKFILAISLIGLLSFSTYCYSLFHELEQLMAQAPETQPSIIYSDLYILKNGDNFPNSFLVERLKDLKIKFTETADSVEWKSREFSYPEALLAYDSPLRIPADQNIVVQHKDERVVSILVGNKIVDSIVIEPTPAAHLTGSGTSIRDYLRLDQIPTELLQAIIAIEDQRFLEHIGFDVRSLARAVWINLRSGSLSQGGSTITQQLIKNLLNTRQKTLFRKFRELVLAVVIEVRYSKDLILEKYLNEVYFGQIGSLEVHGVAEAARYFFNKPLQQLTLAEMALIAGVIRGPAYYSPYKHVERVLERKDVVLKKMAELKLITEPELKAALAQKLSFAPPTQGSNKAPYFSDYVKAQILEQLKEKITAEDLSTQGLRIFTTLDIPLQRRADQAVSNSIRELETRYKIERPLRLEGLLVAADPKSGFVRTIVGGRSYSETTFNRALNMKRQVGSTFKPIVYLAAFQKGKDAKGTPYSAAYMVDDMPWAYKYGEQVWSPSNYEKSFRGHITLREAFANSINIPMAKIGMDVGVSKIIETARKLGIRDQIPAVPSLTLGSVELGAMDLLQAYTTLANRGERNDLTTVRVVLDSGNQIVARYVPRTEKVFENNQIDLLNDLLRSVVKEGTAKALTNMGYTKTAYGKTGTTSFSRDAWFAGFSQGLVAVTWTGFEELKLPEEVQDKLAVDKDKKATQAAKEFTPPAPLTGAGSALPTWARFFIAAKPAKLEELELPIDPSIEKRKIDRSTGLLAKSSCPESLVYDEIFLPSTSPEKLCESH